MLKITFIRSLKQIKEMGDAAKKIKATLETDQFMR